MESRLIADIARRQHGLVTFDQLGANRYATDHAVASGRLEPVRRGVFRVAGIPPTWEQEVMAAVLAIPASRASHRTAARLFGFEGFDGDVVEVTVRGRQRTRRAGVVVHDTTIVGGLHGAKVLGIPCMSVARTLCDLCPGRDRAAIELAVDDALRRRLVTLPRLAAVLTDLDRPGRRGTALMRAVLDARSDGVGPGDSQPEVRIARLLVGAGLPRPVQQYPVRANGRLLRIDLAYPALLIALEFDGWVFHSSRSAFDRDRARANDLEVLGWSVLRFTSRSPDAAIVRTVERAIARRRGTSAGQGPHN